MQRTNSYLGKRFKKRDMNIELPLGTILPTKIKS